MYSSVGGADAMPTSTRTTLGSRKREGRRNCGCGDERSDKCRQSPTPGAVPRISRRRFLPKPAVCSVALEEPKDGGLNLLEKRRVDEDLNCHQYEDASPC